jgi:hypothetical protein
LLTARKDIHPRCCQSNRRTLQVSHLADKYTLPLNYSISSHGKKLNQNIKLDEALLSRFDLIFVLLDKPDAEIDRYLSEQILAQISRNDRQKNKSAFLAAKSLGKPQFRGRI